MHIEIEPGVRVFVDTEGAGWVTNGPCLKRQPTLILIHGGPGFDHTGFKPFFSRLSDIAQIVYYDQRGHGRSDPRPSSEWTLDTFADDVVRLCDRLGIDKPIVLGQSFGGFVAQRYLARHPRHPARVVLSSTSPRCDVDAISAAFGRLGGAQAEIVARAFWEHPNEQTWADYETHCRHLYNTRPKDPEAAGRMVFRPEILFDFANGEQKRMQLLPGLAAAQCPVLVMHGEQDPVTPIGEGEAIHDALPAAWRQFARFPDVGHGAWRDDPEAALRVLRAFILAESEA